MPLPITKKERELLTYLAVIIALGCLGLAIF
jgi:hypothetical protein